MKKRNLAIIIVIVAFYALILFFPFKQIKTPESDQWRSIVCRYVKWKVQKVTPDGIEEDSIFRLYFLGKNNDQYISNDKPDFIAPKERFEVTDIRKWLDEVGFVKGMEEKDLVALMKKYKYYSKSFYDYANVYNIDEKGRKGVVGTNSSSYTFRSLEESGEGKTTRENYFHLTTNQFHFPIPKNITYGTRIEVAAAALGIDISKLPEGNNANENNEVTVYSSDNYTVTLSVDSKRVIEQAKIIFTEKTKYTKNGKEVTSIRRVILVFDKNQIYNNSYGFTQCEIKVIESWENSENVQVAENLYDIRTWLDENGYTYHMPLSVEHLARNRYKYIGNYIEDFMEEVMQGDSYDGFTSFGRGKNFDYDLNYTDIEGKINIINSFSSKINVIGLELPKDIKIGSRTIFVLAKLGINCEKLNNFNPDTKDGKEMTIFESDGLKISLLRNETHFTTQETYPYALCYFENANLTYNSYPSKVSRVVKFYFTHDEIKDELVLGRYSISVNENNRTEVPVSEDVVNVGYIFEKLYYTKEMNQSKFFNLLRDYHYNGKNPLDMATISEYDTEKGGGVIGKHKLFFFKDLYESEDSVQTYSLELKSSVDLFWFDTPVNNRYTIIRIGSGFDYVTSIFGLGINLTESFTPDTENGTEMTLHTEDGRTIKLIKSGNKGGMPDTLLLSEDKKTVRTDGKTCRLERQLELKFKYNDEAEELELESFHIKLKETW